MISLYAPYARAIAWRALPGTVLGTTRYFFDIRVRRVVVPGLVSLLVLRAKRWECEEGSLESRGGTAGGIGGSLTR